MTWWREIRPLEFLAVQRNLPGLVARRRLLGAAHPGDEDLEAGLRRGILLMQLSRGSWSASVGWTAVRLEQLRLLGMGPSDGPVRRAIDWLAERQMSDGSFAEREEVVNSYATVVGDEMPFARRGPDLTAFALAPLLRMGLSGEPIVDRGLAHLREAYRGGKRCCPRCTANMLATLASSPQDREGPGAASGVEWLASIQKSGGWRNAGGAPFYLILEALSRFDHPAVDRQVHAALPLLRRLMHTDGGWGTAHRAEKSLAVCRALCGPLSASAPRAVPPRLAAFLSE
jgi:hypothetical protein